MSLEVKNAIHKTGIMMLLSLFKKKQKSIISTFWILRSPVYDLARFWIDIEFDTVLKMMLTIVLIKRHPDRGMKYLRTENAYFWNDSRTDLLRKPFPELYGYCFYVLNLWS